MTNTHKFKDTHYSGVNEIIELVEHFRNGTTAQSENVVICSTDVYTSSKIAELEFEKIFKSRAYLLGTSADLPCPGAFMRVNDGVQEVLAVRDSDGKFRVFVNACAHRGFLVEQRKSGVAKNDRLVCRFHAWSYNLDGSLKSVNQSAKFGNVDYSCSGLVELPALEKYGLLWAHTQVDGVIDLDAEIGEDLINDLDNLEFYEMTKVSSEEYPMKCNWKLGIDGFGESYHFPSFHARTLGAVMHSHTTTFKEYNNTHYRTYVARHGIDKLVDLPQDEWELSDAAFTVYILFPNTIVIAITGGCILAWLTPDRHDLRKHVLKVNSYTYKDVSLRDVEDVARRDELVEQYNDTEKTVPEFETLADLFRLIIVEEDYDAAEKIQEQYDNSVDSVMFGKNESGVQTFHKVLRRKLGLPEMKVYNED